MPSRHGPLPDPQMSCENKTCCKISLIILIGSLGSSITFKKTQELDGVDVQDTKQTAVLVTIQMLWI